MTDQTAFERQLSSEIAGLMGPVRPVDDLAVFDAVIAANRPPRWGFMMFSTLKLVAASAIVALFGGLLLTGLLTTQDGDGLPAAVTESPSPMTSEELLAGMVTEEVEPGVLRITDDGIHDLKPDIYIGDQGFPSHFVDVAPDGGVWLSGGGHLGDGLYRLGDARSYEDAGDDWGPNRRHLFAPDGTLWAYSPDSVRTLDEGTWVVRSLDGLDIHDLAVGPDGQAWAVVEGPVRRSLVKLASEPDAGYSYRTVDGWRELVDGIYFRPEAIEVTPDGTIWLLGAGRAQVQLLRFADQRWQIVDTPASPLKGAQPRDLAAGPDGSLWLVGNHWDDDRTQNGLTLQRLDSDGWSTFDERGAGIGWGHGIGVFLGSYQLDVAPDGAVWLNAYAGEVFDHAGVARFDGTAWRRFLDGHSVHDIDVGPDGAAWVRASASLEEGLGAPELFVITPGS